ncbi:SCO family protein [Martelella mediterranea]|uniref:SCO family protein n=1 Tax=Martelella mediterranea TaxID=293089 RepID=UPI001E3CD198|nr:SCO family protein [Martelella mediterranea]MCD1636712.1 SCO family protein [Martelella mediterranea]
MTSTRTTQLRRIRYGLWIVVAAATLTLGGTYLVRTIGFREPPRPIIVGEAAVHSEFSLTDHNGNRVTEANFRGRWQLVFFGFTHCPDVCPTTLAYMAEVLDRIGNQSQHIAPLFITVDPTRDTPEVMAEYVRAFHPDLIGLTGTEAEIGAAAHAFRVYYEKMEEASAPDGYLMAHAGHIYLMTPEGRYEAVFREGEQSAQEMASKIVTTMNR